MLAANIRESEPKHVLEGFPVWDLEPGLSLHEQSPEPQSCHAMGQVTLPALGHAAIEQEGPKLPKHFPPARGEDSNLQVQAGRMYLIQGSGSVWQSSILRGGTMASHRGACTLGACTECFLCSSHLTLGSVCHILSPPTLFQFLGFTKALNKYDSQ